MTFTAGQDNVPFMDLVAHHAPLKQQMLAAFGEVLDRAVCVGGSALERFEPEFARGAGSRYAVGVSSGTDALRFALLALRIGPGMRVITVPNTFIATTEAISQAGAQFDFIDVDPATCLMDPNRLEDHLRRVFASSDKHQRPAGIVPVHLYGQGAEMEAIMSLANKYQLKVLEDAAQAHGATHKAKAAGTFGDAAAFSFYPAKNLGACGEGGAVTTDDPALADRVRMYRDHGQNSKYFHAVEGYNGRLDALQAALLSVKLPHLAGWNAARREIAGLYDQQFSGIDWIRPVELKPHNVSAHHLYVIHAAQRDRLQQHLAQRRVGTGLHYPLPLHLQECYAHLGLAAGSYPNAERSARELLSLPMFAELGKERAAYVVDAVKAFQ